MRHHIASAAFALLASTTLAFAQDDSATIGATTGELDDAAVVSTAETLAGAADDADMDSGSDLAGAQAINGPVAFGAVQSNGSKFSGSNNFSSSFNSTYNRYEISIAGQNYYYLNYATLITPAGDSRFCKSSSVGGKLLVYCYDHTGNVQPARFGFVVFKP